MSDEVTVSSKTAPAHTVGSATGATSVYDKPGPAVADHLATAIGARVGSVSREQGGATFHTAPGIEVAWGARGSSSR